MDYEENIAQVKTEFLAVFDEIENNGQAATEALAMLIYGQVEWREKIKITMSIPKTQDIGVIVGLFKAHFFANYKGSKGASRLPVLALYAIYSVMIPQLKRYNGKILRSLQEHSAADSQTGSVGDIEVEDQSTTAIYEAVEVKHLSPITEAIVADAQEKIMDKQVSRYYILTTHNNCDPDPGAKKS